LRKRAAAGGLERRVLGGGKGSTVDCNQCGIYNKVVLTLRLYGCRCVYSPVMNEIEDGVLNLADPLVVSPDGDAEDLALYEWIRVKFSHEILVCQIWGAREQLAVVFETFGHDAVDAGEEYFAHVLGYC
jgi:hypothetical protein